MSRRGTSAIPIAPSITQPYAGPILSVRSVNVKGDIEPIAIPIKLTNERAKGTIALSRACGVAKTYSAEKPETTENHATATSNVSKMKLFENGIIMKASPLITSIR